jgi:hypothetical protein
MPAASGGFIQLVAPARVVRAIRANFPPAISRPCAPFNAARHAVFTGRSWTYALLLHRHDMPSCGRQLRAEWHGSVAFYVAATVTAKEKGELLAPLFPHVLNRKA